MNGKGVPLSDNRGPWKTADSNRPYIHTYIHEQYTIDVNYTLNKTFDSFQEFDLAINRSSRAVVVVSNGLLVYPWAVENEIVGLSGES